MSAVCGGCPVWQPGQTIEVRAESSYQIASSRSRHQQVKKHLNWCRPCTVRRCNRQFSLLPIEANCVVTFAGCMQASNSLGSPFRSNSTLRTAAPEEQWVLDKLLPPFKEADLLPPVAALLLPLCNLVEQCSEYSRLPVVTCKMAPFEVPPF